MRLLGFIGAGVLVFGTVFVVLMRGRGSGEVADVHSMERLLASEFASAPAVKIEQGAALVERLKAAPWGPPPGFVPMAGLSPPFERLEPSVEEHEALLETIGEWLRLLSAGDGAAYEGWARARGCTLEDDPKLRERCAVSFLHMTGKELAPDASGSEVFRAMFSASLAHRGGEARPDSISGSPEAIRIRYLACSGVTSFAPVFFRTNDEVMRWIGFESKATRRHWRAPVDLEELYERHGRVACAAVSLAYRGRTGKWSPVNAVLFLDPSSRRWHFRTVVVVNSPSVQATLDY